MLCVTTQYISGVILAQNTSSSRVVPHRYEDRISAVRKSLSWCFKHTSMQRESRDANACGRQSLSSKCHPSIRTRTNSSSSCRIKNSWLTFTMLLHLVSIAVPLAVTYISSDTVTAEAGTRNRNRQCTVMCSVFARLRLCSPFRF